MLRPAWPSGWGSLCPILKERFCRMQFPRVKNSLIGMLFAHNPLGALIALGWIARNENLSSTNAWLLPPREGWTNFKRGLQLFIAAMLLLFPALFVMQASWIAGWHISFFKDYESSNFGRLTGFLLFCLLRQRMRSTYAAASAKSHPSSLIMSAVPLLLTFLVWVAVAIQIYAAQFFNYIPIRGFSIQPFLQLPWFNPLP